MLKKLEKYFLNKSIGVLGINESHPIIYKALNYVTNKMNHYIVINPKKKIFKFLKIGVLNNLPYPQLNTNSLRYNEMTEEKILFHQNIFKQKNLNGIKTNMFFYYKYLNNPFYKYRVFHLLLEKKKVLLLYSEKYI